MANKLIFKGRSITHDENGSEESYFFAVEKLTKRQIEALGGYQFAAVQCDCEKGLLWNRTPLHAFKIQTDAIAYVESLYAQREVTK